MLAKQSRPDDLLGARTASVVTFRDVATDDAKRGELRHRAERREAGRVSASPRPA